MNPLADLTVVTEAFLRDLATAEADAPLADVRWTVHDLASHLGSVHRWAVGNIRSGVRGSREDVPELGVPALDWYAESRELLLSTLREVNADAPCYTMSEHDTSVRFWHRRQLFETLVHLWDLRSARNPAEPPPPEVAPEVHADGVSEVFDVSLPRSNPRDRVPLGGRLDLVATDTGSRWSFDADWRRDGGGGAPDATVSAPAGELLLWVWNRGSARWPQSLRFGGDGDVVSRFMGSKIHG